MFLDCRYYFENFSIFKPKTQPNHWCYQTRQEVISIHSFTTRTENRIILTAKARRQGSLVEIYVNLTYTWILV